MTNIMQIFLKALNLSISASYLIIAIIAARLILKRAPKALYCVLWLLVAIRLVFPFSIESVFSLVPAAPPIAPDIIYEDAPHIDTGDQIADTSVNNYLQQNMAPQQRDDPRPAAQVQLQALDGRHSQNEQHKCPRAQTGALTQVCICPLQQFLHSSVCRLLPQQGGRLLGKSASGEKGLVLLGQTYAPGADVDALTGARAEQLVHPRLV